LSSLFIIVAYSVMHSKEILMFLTPEFLPVGLLLQMAF
jgi:hypothetical protein